MTDPQTPPADPTPGVPAPEPQPEPPVTETEKERRATTAGEQDHSDPDALRGDDADAPADTGKPAQES